MRLLRSMLHFRTGPYCFTWKPTNVRGIYCAIHCTPAEYTQYVSESEQNHWLSDGSGAASPCTLLYRTKTLTEGSREHSAETPITWADSWKVPGKRPLHLPDMGRERQPRRSQTGEGGSRTTERWEWGGEITTSTQTKPRYCCKERRADGRAMEPAWSVCVCMCPLPCALTSAALCVSTPARPTCAGLRLVRLRGMALGVQAAGVE